LRSSWAEEPVGLPILEAKAPCERGVLVPLAHINALRRIELVLTDEHDAQAGQRFAAPAHGRSATVRQYLTSIVTPSAEIIRSKQASTSALDIFSSAISGRHARPSSGHPSAA